MTGVLTGLVYDGLPETYRTLDEAGGGPLLTYLDGLLGQFDPIMALIDRVTYVPADDDQLDPTETSDLVDPALADAGWLPWLRQLVGVPLLEGQSIAEQRTALADPPAAWAHGTPVAIAAAARRGLTGTKTVQVVPHYEGDPWVIGVGTLEAETDYLDTFAKLKAAAPRWRDLHTLGSFSRAKAPLPMAYAALERPAGYRLAHFIIDA